MQIARFVSDLERRYPWTQMTQRRRMTGGLAHRSPLRLNRRPIRAYNFVSCNSIRGRGQ